MTLERAVGGVLAATVPLVAGSASAQGLDCPTITPSGPIVISSILAGTTYPNIVSFSVGGTPVGLVYITGSRGTATTSRLKLASFTQWFPFVVATTQPDQPIRREASYNSAATIQPGTTYGYVSLCVNSGGQSGLFCPPTGPGFIPGVGPLGRGFLELEVVSMSGGKATVQLLSFQIGDSNADPDFIHAGDCSPSLPVELVSFIGVVDDGMPVLSWETLSEVNNAGFEVQRSQSGGAFEKVAFVAGNGTTSDRQVYRFADETARPNTAYRYRLKQIDLDGTFAFSDQVEAFTEVPGQVVVSGVYPNPVGSGSATLQINVPEADQATIEVYDVRGSVVFVEAHAIDRGLNRIRLESDGLASGSHFVKIQIGEHVQYRSFVVVD